MLSDRDLHRAVADLAVPGSLANSAVARRLVRRVGGLTHGPPPFPLPTRSPIAERPSGLARLQLLADATTWTVRLCADELAEECVRIHPQLTPLMWWLLHEASVPLVDAEGRAAGVAVADDARIDGRSVEVLRGPSGWLSPAGCDAAAVVVAGGALRIGPCPVVPTPTARQVRALRAAFAECAVEESVEMFAGEPARLRFARSDEPMLTALKADREAFVAAPIPPLEVLYAEAGLEERGHVLAEAPFAWSTLDSWRTRNRYQSSLGLTPDEADRLRLLVCAARGFRAQGAEVLGGDEAERDRAAVLIAALLESSAVAAVVVIESLMASAPPDVVGGLADAVAERFDAAPPGVAWLQAQARLSSDRPHEAITVLEEAVGREAADGPAALELAGLLADRGDAVGAYRLLQTRATTRRDGGGRDRDEAARLLEEVEPYACRRPRVKAGRNERCPCGSGRKFKVCHLGREQHPLGDRARWLFEKEMRFVRNDPRDAARLAARAVDPRRWPAAHQRLIDVRYFDDVLLHEGGVAESFLSERGELLPDDEQELADEWLYTDRAVFEVVAADGVRLELRDVETAQRITVVNAVDVAAGPGTLCVGRPLPVGRVYRSFAGLVPLVPELVDDMLEAITDRDTHAIAATLGRSLRLAGVASA